MSETRESINSVSHIVEKNNQRWNSRFEFPLTKIPERYTGLQNSIALQVACQVSGIQFGICLLIRFNEGENLLREKPHPSVETEERFLMFIDNIELVDDRKGVVQRVGGFVGLHSFDQITNLGIRDPLYLSFKSGKFVFLNRLFSAHRKINRHVVLLGAGGEVPYDMVETGSQVMNDLPCQHTESWWNATVLMILKGLKENLVVVLWDSGIIAFIKEPLDLRVEIKDVLFGPV